MSIFFLSLEYVIQQHRINDQSEGSNLGLALNIRGSNLDCEFYVHIQEK